MGRVCGLVSLINCTCHHSGCTLVQDEETCDVVQRSLLPATRCRWYEQQRACT
jgi:hypothetical protein